LNINKPNFMKVHRKNRKQQQSIGIALVTLFIICACDAAIISGSATRKISPAVEIAAWIQSKGLLTGPKAFSHPTGIAVNGSGYVYVCDTINNRIQVFGPDGHYVTSWGVGNGNGSAGNKNGEFSSPFGVAVNSTGAVYVADSSNQRVQVFSSTGQFLFKINKTSGGNGKGNGEFAQPEGVGINASGYLYVADTFNNRVQVFTPRGAFVTKWGSGGGNGSSGIKNGEFDLPTAIAFNSTGQVYVADSANRRVEMFTQAGKYLANLTGFSGSYGPSGIAINSTDYVYVTDSDGSDAVNIYTPSGNWFAFWQLERNHYPWGIAINATHHIFVSEYYSTVVEIFAVLQPQTGGSPEGNLMEIIIISIACAAVAVVVVILLFLNKKRQRKPDEVKSESSQP